MLLLRDVGLPMIRVLLSSLSFCSCVIKTKAKHTDGLLASMSVISGTCSFAYSFEDMQEFRFVMRYPATKRKCKTTLLPLVSK